MAEKIDNTTYLIHELSLSGCHVTTAVVAYYIGISCDPFVIILRFAFVNFNVGPTGFRFSYAGKFGVGLVIINCKVLDNEGTRVGSTYLCAD